MKLLSAIMNETHSIIAQNYEGDDIDINIESCSAGFDSEEFLDKMVDGIVGQETYGCIMFNGKSRILKIFNNNHVFLGNDDNDAMIATSAEHDLPKKYQEFRNAYENCFYVHKSINPKPKGRVLGIPERGIVIQEVFTS
jgi:hypothetical protein